VPANHAADFPGKIAADAAKAWERIPRALCLGLKMERAFSALVSPIRFPSPLGWVDMMGAFGAPRFAEWGCPRTLTRNVHLQARTSRPCESCNQHTGETPARRPCHS